MIVHRCAAEEALVEAILLIFFRIRFPLLFLSFSLYGLKESFLKALLIVVTLFFFVFLFFLFFIFFFGSGVQILYKGANEEKSKI